MWLFNSLCLCLASYGFTHNATAKHGSHVLRGLLHSSWPSRFRVLIFVLIEGQHVHRPFVKMSTRKHTMSIPLTGVGFWMAVTDAPHDGPWKVLQQLS
ncbi:hypothetical protein F5148DRAFT_1215865 [Russula earlei]|uniref:Uncharacterized protein n=1 Tax=Russula earlei TaxID=71964 RepID=A0ACC0U3B9_9AGAM|nr:hypothetical protein F5148DRAFT_1215865 [Russula earlei]